MGSLLIQTIHVQAHKQLYHLYINQYLCIFVLSVYGHYYSLVVDVETLNVHTTERRVWDIPEQGNYKHISKKTFDSNVTIRNAQV